MAPALDHRFPCGWLAVLPVALLFAGPVGAAETEVSAWITKRGGQPISPVASLSGLRVGETIEVQIRLVPGSGGVGSYSVSSRFDAGGANVLDLAAVERLESDAFADFPVPPDAPEVESEASRAGQVKSIAAISFPPDGGLAEGTAAQALARLTLTAARPGTTAIEVGAFAAATDGIFLQDGVTEAAPVYVAAAVSVPEPGAAGLAVALASLAGLAGFRRIRTDAGRGRRASSGAGAASTQPFHEMS